jgi:GMP synthase-like glutamine amidotransferase
VPMGAPWSVYDHDLIGTWAVPELDLLRAAHTAGVPVLGICFGGQMLAAAVGGTVSRAPIPEVGWVSIASDEPALIDAGPWLQWHNDRFTLPAGIPVLARTAVANQAFVYGRALGVQFHPEVTDAVLESWLDIGDSERLAEAGIDPAPMIEQARTLADGAAARAHGLVRRFVLDVARRPAQPFPLSPPPR